ncbi:flagellar basal body-associated protein FliL [Shewanella youngdeokensis]|uniref:Flagellar protein FliL n=1 Tax=Shewanella youngdeokensis TaxID=2999068 RepID=A0ABZ0K128_9GAMM|nr:flagellar basal body-associated protein FliL [Shewanella sp. DAU334]
MAEQSLELEVNDEPKSKKKLYLFGGIAVVLAIIIGVAVWMLLSSDAEKNSDSGEVAAEATGKGEAFYVGMPRPFLFNLPANGRSRLVEIKVQLMVRGQEDDVLVKKHIPLVEDALLTTFSGADFQKLSTQIGKDEMRQLAVRNVQNTLQPIVGREVVEKVLFTGFVMQ